MKLKKNLAAVLVKQHNKLSVYKLENLSFIPARYVLIKVKYSGICHTQLNEIRGVLGKDKFLPHCIGHEGVGVVVKVGSGVKNVKIGEKVVISWIKNRINKQKYDHVHYQYKGKKINTGGCNTLLNYSLVSDDRVFKISNKNK
jgi:D-arabinose 1-dehydrogenase-like Zn-dependent alcohol dehydrogenase